MSLPTTADEIWEYVEKWPFAILGFVTPQNEARAAGVMYTVRDRVLYVITGPDTWKARHIHTNPHVSVTVPVQRMPVRVRMVPPAVITFSGLGELISLDSLDRSLQEKLTRGVEGIGDVCVIRIEPVGRFVTYGIGVPPMKMRHPGESLAKVPVGRS